ncbi:hypothetical protein [Endozoicomonas sp. ALC020]|uniref:hypothetical protein n=2 Tax=unclassified Endozoicomonas TaxID=2644528 RepID=UPI003BB1AA9C
MLMSHSVSRLPETVKRLILFRRNNTNQWVAATLSLVAMACPCSKLLAGNPFSTPVEEKFIIGKMTKESGFLEDLINHNTYIGKNPPSALSPNTTHLIFAMNHENQQGEKMDEDSEASEGAGAQQPQHLMQIPLPPMTLAEVATIIEGLNTGFNQATLNTMLSYVPATPPNGDLTILIMLQQLIKTLNITVQDNQNVMVTVLSSIQGTTSPVDITKPQDRRRLATLMLAYYTAIHSNGASPRAANVFFNSFLLHATQLSGIERLDAKKGDLLGTDEPIEAHEILKAKLKESASIFSALVALEEMRFDFLEQMENPLEADRFGTSADDLQLIAASSLLNYDVNENEESLYECHINSAERMLILIKEYGENKPELVALNSQFINLLNAIRLTLDPFTLQSATALIHNISSYLSKSKSYQTSTEVRGIMSKEQKLFEIFRNILTDAKDNPGNENPELFKELFVAIKKYISHQLKNMFADENDYQVIMVTLGTGFADLLGHARMKLSMLEPTIDTNANELADDAVHRGAAKGKKGIELNKDGKTRKHLKERIDYFIDFVDWFRFYYDFAMKNPYDSDTSDSQSDDSEIKILRVVTPH